MTSTRVAQSLALAGLLLAATERAQAQSCMGLPSLSRVSHNVSAIADAYGSQRSVLARVGSSTERIFGGIQAGYIGDKVQNPDRPVVGADAGFTIALGNAPKALQLCPMVQSLIQFQSGAVRDRTTQSLLGFSVGQEFRLSSKVAIAPYVDGALARWSFHYNYDTVGLPADASANSAFKNYELGARYGAGFGMRLGDALTIRPSFHFLSGFRPTGGDENQPGASLSVSYGFRRK